MKEYSPKIGKIHKVGVKKSAFVPFLKVIPSLVKTPLYYCKLIITCVMEVM